MKVYFQERDLIIESESYVENIALETWSDTFFKRMDYSKNIEESYYLLCKLYSNKEEMQYEQK